MEKKDISPEQIEFLDNQAPKLQNGTIKLIEDGGFVLVPTPTDYEQTVNYIISFPDCNAHLTCVCVPIGDILLSSERQSHCMVLCIADAWDRRPDRCKAIHSKQLWMVSRVRKTNKMSLELANLTQEMVVRSVSLCLWRRRCFRYRFRQGNKIRSSTF